MKLILPLFTLLSALCMAQSPVTHSASTLELNSSASWSLIRISARNNSGNCSFSASSVSSPNNNRIQANWTVNNASSGRRGEIGLLLNSATYSPATEGEAQSIDFTINHAFVTLSPKSRLLIRQAGNYYVSSAEFSSKTQSSSNLSAESFSQLNTTDSGSTNILLISDSHPNFTSTGATMDFGIWAFQASSGQAGGSSTEAAFDCGEFSVAINPPNNGLNPFASYTRELSEEATRPAAAAGAPNILLIMCDDLGYGDTGLTGHPAIETPTIDNLRTQGAFCTNYYSAANICSPSRASMITGRMPYRLGVYSFIRDAEDYVHLHHSETTLPQVLQKVGYECANIGKWHVSHLDAITPEHLPTMRHYGFDYWLSSDNNLQILNKNGWWRNETEVGTINGYAGEVVSDEIIDWLDNTRDPNRPFFLFANYYEPHADSKAPADLVTKYENLGHASGPAQYYACVEHVDTQIARILQKLDDANLSDNTLVIFTSDHGPNPGSTSRYGTAAPFRGTKYQVWDGSTHVPTIIRWPGKVTANSTITENIGSIDLLQTLAAITDAEEFLPTDRPLDGTDFSSLLTGVGSFSRTTPLQWHYYKSSASSLTAGSPQAALRIGDLVISGFYDNPFSFGNVRWMPIPSQNNGIIEMDYITGTGTQVGRTLSLSSGSFRLYNIASDPHQDTDIYDPANPIHTDLRDQLIHYHQTLQAQAPGWGFRTDAPDYSDYNSWKASFWSGADLSNDTITGPNADPDNDGNTNLREYALAGNPVKMNLKNEDFASSIEEVTVNNVTSHYLTFSFKSSPNSSANIEGNSSTDLLNWNSDPSQFTLTNRYRETDGCYRIFYRLNQPISAGDKPEEFTRIKITP